jgi:REP element-mobilizing transposase RayT
LKSVCFEICKMYCLEFDATGIDIDQVHLLVDFEPKYSPSKLCTLKMVSKQEKSLNNIQMLGKNYDVRNCKVMEVRLELLVR